MKWAGVVMLACGLSGPALAAGNSAAGKEKAAACMACHGEAGKSSAPVYPNLAGQQQDYLEAALHAYKSGDRSAGQAAIMSGYASELSDQDIQDLAAWYAAQKP
ncbi:cytochrome C554 [Chimaeribacter coloradensis]|uniref:Cytochrome C554 n=1 Tax=Chimaeribacter coloradensis TaxID=2060068 RepID=A0A2N5DX16_9GAMM|nr:cytochrome c [Chimaeribacter coloradensis]PLR31886.1 cytochrome C554 [Chimaeribacter coloradensis]